MILAVQRIYQLMLDNDVRRSDSQEQEVFFCVGLTKGKKSPLAGNRGVRPRSRICKCAVNPRIEIPRPVPTVYIKLSTSVS